MRGNRLKLARGLLGLALLLLLIDCGGGGGGGSSGGPPPTVVSGTVQAPGGQIAFYREQGLLERLAELLAPSAYAAVSGLSSVADGTQVELGRISAAGTVTRIATTTTAGGKYSFNLTSLGLGFSSDLVVRVLNTGSGAQMRGFVAGETVNIDPISESAVRIVFDQIVASPGSSLSDFTAQELRDLLASLDLLTTIKQAAAGLTIESAVTTIRQYAAADAGLTAFVAAAAATGETTEGPGDVGNYFPIDQGNIWRSLGTKSETGQQAVGFINSTRIAGTKAIGGGLTATVFAENNPDASGQGIENYVIKDSRGVSLHGNNDTTDILTPQFVPYRILRFPLQAGAIFESINRKGLTIGDLDLDGKNEKIDVLEQVSIVALESVTVPVGTFAHSAKIETKNTSTVTLSSDGSKVTVSSTQTLWLAPGLGPVKRQAEATGEGFSETISEELAGYFVSGQGKGVVSLTAATSSGNEFMTGRSGLASDGTSYLLVSCRQQGSSDGLFGVFISGASAGTPFPIASGDCTSLGGTSENSISQPSVAFDGTNYLVVFVKGAIIRGMRVSPSGTVLDGPNGFAISTGQLFSISSFFPAVAFGGGSYLVVWTKFIPVLGAGTRNVFGAVVNPAGQVSAEIPVSPEQHSQDQLGFALDLGSPSVAFDGTNFLATWNKVRTGPGSSIYSDLFAVYSDFSAARITPQGAVLETQGILFSTSGPLSQSPGAEIVPVAFDGANYLAVWRKALQIGFDPPQAEIRGARISPAGALLDGPPPGAGIGISTTTRGKSAPTVAFDGQHFLVAWIVGAFANNPPAGMFGARVSSDGTIVEGLPATDGISLSDPPLGRPGSPVACSNGANVLLTWFDEGSTSGRANYLPASLIFR